MINFIREFIKKNEKINICYYYNKENIEEKVSEISKELGLPI